MGNAPTNLTFYAPIEKADDEQRMVYGYASTEALDSQGEVVKKDALKDALADYMRFANIREMHQPSAVGKTKKANIDNKGLYIAAKVVDDKAWEKVKEGVYTGFSIGGRVESMIENEITALRLAEISLVDRPANPEAVFDVYKAEGMEPKAKEGEEETPEPKDPVSEKAETTEIKKNIWGAANLIDLACNLFYEIDSMKVKGEDTAKMEDALKTIKEAAAMKLGEDESYPADFLAAIEEGQKIVDLAKGRKKKEDEPKTDPAEQKVGEDAPATEREPAQPGTVEQPKDATPAQPGTTEQPTEHKELADKPKDLKKHLDEKLRSGVMPTDEELAELLKSEGIEASDKAINVLRFDLAGVLLKYIQKAVSDKHEQEAKTQAVEKAQQKTQVVAAKPHQFDGVLALVDRLEKELGKAKDAPVSPQAPNETSSEALTLLRRAIELLAGENTGNQLTPSEEEKLRNGVNAGSERTSEGRVKTEQTGDIAKLEGEIDTLKAEIEKLQKQPAPVKVAASYQTVNKFDKPSTHDALEKAEARSQELQAILKGPHSAQDEEEAAALSLQILKLRREVSASVN